MDTKHYEILYIISIKFLGEEKKITEKVNSLLKKHDAEITAENMLGKQRLAYPINKASQGIYVAAEFDLDPTRLAKLNSDLFLTSELLRHLIIVKKQKTVADIEREKEVQAKILKRKEAKLEEVEKKDAEETGMKKVSADEKPKKTAKKKEKISLDDLDTKLDEILKTDEIL